MTAGDLNWRAMSGDNVITSGEFRALLATAARDGLGAGPGRRATIIAGRPAPYWAFLIAGNLGLRVGELAALAVCSTRLESRPPCLMVRTLKQRGADLAPDAVPMGRMMAAAVRRLVAGRPHDDAPLIYHRAGRQLGPGVKAYSVRGLEAAFTRCARAAGIIRAPGWRVSFHALRHFHGSQLYGATRDLELVRRRLRHRSASSTARYVHLDPSRLAAALEAIEIGPVSRSAREV